MSATIERIYRSHPSFGARVASVPSGAQDFMFQLTNSEFDDLKCKTGTSSGWGDRRYAPYAFTAIKKLMDADKDSPKNRRIGSGREGELDA